MPGIKTTKSLRSSLPPEIRDQVEDLLWEKSGGKCFLCLRHLNIATDDIDVDHDLPTSDGGSNDLSNLNLAHSTCNRAKRNYPSGDVRPYLRLKAFAHERENVVGYEALQEHFGFTPKDSVLEWSQGDLQAKWHFPDGNIQSTPVYSETDGRGNTYFYCFVDAPKEAIYNDNECQPRNIKLNQAWAIYADLESNPLHEPPSSRVIHRGNKTVRLAMFDGQHKSVALWMHGRSTAVIKVYLTLDREKTIKLVGSIQSRIKKLPLSSFETALKMGEEWAAHADEYESRVGTENASESGLIGSLPSTERKRAKDAFQQQLIKEMLELEDLKLLRFVQRAGRTNTPYQLITETAFKKKVLEVLRHMAPLDDQGENWQKARAREVENIKFALNTLTDLVFLNTEGGTELDVPSHVSRRERMKYQSSLAYVSMLIRRLYRQILSIDDESRAFLEKDPTPDQVNLIQQGIRRITEHPIWVCDLNKTDATRAVQDAMSKNQDAANAFRNVELRVDYVIGSEPLPSDWAKE